MKIILLLFLVINAENDCKLPEINEILLKTTEFEIFKEMRV